MTASSTLPAPNLIPLMRYRELADAMSWLEQAFGFEKQVAVSDSDGSVIYGQMTYRGSLMMMGAVRNTDLDKLMLQPDEVGGAETQSCYIVVEDADEHYARALEQGAEVVLEIKSDGLGRRGYSCRDPEGHIWNFGTYNPGRGYAGAPSPPQIRQTVAAAPVRASRSLRMSLTGLIAALCVTCWWFADEMRADFAMRLAGAAEVAHEAERAYAELVKVRAEKRKVEAVAQSLTETLEAERARRIALESNAGLATEKLAQEERARRAAEATVVSLQNEIKLGKVALDAAVEARRVSEERLAVKSVAPDPAPQAAAPLAEAQAIARTEMAAEQPAAPPQTQSPIPASTSTAAPAGASGIETSATRPASEPVSQTPIVVEGDADDTPEASQSVVDKPRTPSRTPIKWVQKNRKPVVIRTSRFVPTYVVGLHEVPWPYNTWYK
jgi:uncharacterized glyoxalase superfamily protein PhnB